MLQANFKLAKVNDIVQDTILGPGVINHINKEYILVSMDNGDIHKYSLNGGMYGCDSAYKDNKYGYPRLFFGTFDQFPTEKNIVPFRKIITINSLSKEKRQELATMMDNLEKLFILVETIGESKEYIEGESNYYVFFNHSDGLYTKGCDVNFFLQHQVYMDQKTADNVVNFLNSINRD